MPRQWFLPRGDARSRRRVDAGGHRRGGSVNRCSQPGTHHHEARRAGQAPGRAFQHPWAWFAPGDQLELVRLCGHGWNGHVQQRLGRQGGAHGALHPGSQYSSLWAGLDGYSSSTVKQTGSEDDCSRSTPVYLCLVEIYPGLRIFQ
jgi:hypothetical protein